MTRSVTEAHAGDHAEERLVRAAQADLRHFAPLYHRYVGRIYRYIAARVQDRSAAEDLTSEVFLSVLENLQAYRPNSAFGAWIFTIARNSVVSHHRQAQPLGSLDEDNVPWLAADRREGPGRWGDRDDLDLLAQALRGLDDGDRELLSLRFAGGLTYREVAKILGRTPGSVKMAIHRLLHRLERQLEEKHEQAG
ncbi:MAG: sigma-70 family RNA polymerase sigma factor [Chloroflexota bacterium]